MYESYLIEQLGADTGGVLHTARSRNDLKATVTAMRLRNWVLGFAEQAGRLEAALLSRARRHAEVLMPVYTHYQAAMPISYGYYLLGVAEALGRDLAAVRQAASGLRLCPLGAGAVAGTDLPIDPTRTARLLGFSASCPHAIDAVASRDVALRLLAAAAGVAGTLSRLAADLQLWSTAEFGFLRFPDRLVGGSSAMPQKRNAFLLEHIRAKPALAIGAWAAAAAAMSATPFTNSIEVGTEAVGAIWPGLLACEQSVLLCQPLVSAAVPDAARMAERAEAGFINATAMANQLVRQGIPFRTAHDLVGSAVREAVAAGSTQLAGFAQLAGSTSWPVPARWQSGAAPRHRRPDPAAGSGWTVRRGGTGRAGARRRSGRLRRDLAGRLRAVAGAPGVAAVVAVRAGRRRRPARRRGGRTRRRRSGRDRAEYGLRRYRPTAGWRGMSSAAVAGEQHHRNRSAVLRRRPPAGSAAGGVRARSGALSLPGRGRDRHQGGGHRRSGRGPPGALPNWPRGPASSA